MGSRMKGRRGKSTFRSLGQIGQVLLIDMTIFMGDPEVRNVYTVSERTPTSADNGR